MYWNSGLVWSFDAKCCIRWLNIKTSWRRPVQVVSFRLNYHHYFYRLLKSLYVKCYIRWPLITWSNIEIFIDLFTCLPVHTFYAICISIFIFFFMSQRICTCCAHNHLIHEFFDSNSTRVLNLCSFCRVSSVYYIWSTGYITYEALGRPHMEYWIGHIWSTG